jgi:Zn-dependent protease with chaperone function
LDGGSPADFKPAEVGHSDTSSALKLMSLMSSTIFYFFTFILRLFFFGRSIIDEFIFFLKLGVFSDNSPKGDLPVFNGLTALFLVDSGK